MIRNLPRRATDTQMMEYIQQYGIRQAGLVKGSPLTLVPIRDQALREAGLKTPTEEGERRRARRFGTDHRGRFRYKTALVQETLAVEFPDIEAAREAMGY